MPVQAQLFFTFYWIFFNSLLFYGSLNLICVTRAKTSTHLYSTKPYSRYITNKVIGNILHRTHIKTQRGGYSVWLVWFFINNHFTYSSANAEKNFSNVSLSDYSKLFADESFQALIFCVIREHHKTIGLICILPSLRVI